MNEEPSRLHYVDPAEYVPLCIVLGTMVPRDGPCVAVNDPGKVTCRECTVGLGITVVSGTVIEDATTLSRGTLNVSG